MKNQPVHRPSTFSLEIVNYAYGNETRGIELSKKNIITYLWTSYQNNKIKHHILMNKYSSLHCGQVAAILLY